MQSTAATAIRPSLVFRLMWAVKAFPRRIMVAFVQRALLWLASDSNLLAYARRELPTDGGDEMQAAMNRDLLQVLAVFSLQGHSGFSASYAASALEKLLRFQPLGPLTGADDEWIDHGYCKQNNRCSSVFMQPDRFNGQPYDINGRVFREPDGCCYTNYDSFVPITFPYTPKTEYVDVPKQDT